MNRTSKFIGAALFAAAVITHVASAGAQDTGTTAKPERVAPPVDVTVLSYSGPFYDVGEGMGGMLAGLRSQIRIGPAELGVLGEGGLTPFDYKYIGLAGTAGLGWRTPFGLRISMGGTGGAHFYDGVGEGFLDADPGASGTTPFVGGRSRFAYAFGSGKTHFELGLGGQYDHDFARQRVAYDYQDIGWFTGTPYKAHADHVIGSDRIALTLDLGVTFDLGATTRRPTHATRF